VLVLRPGALGDTLLALPALRSMRRAFEQVTLAAHPGAARFLANVGEIDRGLAFDDPSLAWLFANAPLPDTVVAWMAATPGLRGAAVVAASRPPAMDRHCARYLLETLAPLGIDLTWDDHPLRVDPIRSGEVLIHPGSGSAAKNWPASRFADVIRRLDGPVRLVVGEADGAAASAIEAVVGDRLSRLVHPSLEELAARLAGCRAYIGNDSGVSHLAGLCGAHTVVLFGPSDPMVWRPLGPDVQVLPFEADPREVADAI
jgi:ADP-heptose:LPS heptosyltransferase